MVERTGDRDDWWIIVITDAYGLRGTDGILYGRQREGENIKPQTGS